MIPIKIPRKLKLYRKNEDRDLISLLDFTLTGNYVIIKVNYIDADMEFRTYPTGIIKWIENHIKAASEADDIEDEVIGEQTITCVSGKYSVAINN